MQRYLLKKMLVFGTIILFLGVSSVSAVNINLESDNVIKNIENLSPDIKTFYPTDDATIQQNNPDNSLGDGIYINVRNDEGWGQAYWALIKFDISSIPSKAKILYAILNCYYIEWKGISNPYNDRLEIYRLTSDWNEETVTWNKRPLNTPQPTSFTNVPSSPGFWMQWNVTEDVKNFVKGDLDNYGWKISDETWHDWASIIRFCSKEYGSNTPYLEIKFTRSRNKDITNNFFYWFLARFQLLGKLLNIIKIF